MNFVLNPTSNTKINSKWNDTFKVHVRLKTIFNEKKTSGSRAT